MNRPNDPECISLHGSPFLYKLLDDFTTDKPFRFSGKYGGWQENPLFILENYLFAFLMYCSNAMSHGWSRHFQCLNIKGVSRHQYCLRSGRLNAAMRVLFCLNFGKFLKSEVIPDGLKNQNIIVHVCRSLNHWLQSCKMTALIVNPMDWASKVAPKISQGISLQGTRNFSFCVS